MTSIDGIHFLSAIRKREQGYGIGLRNVNIAQLDQALLNLVSYLEVCLDNVRAASSGDNALLSLQHIVHHIVVRQVSTWQDFDRCVALGFDMFSGKFCSIPRPEPVYQKPSMNPSQIIIAQLMSLLKKQADFVSLEAIVQQNPTLLHQLLRYVHADRFDCHPRIHSFSLAVQLFGYGRLYRWLSVLLLKNVADYSPVLMETAMIRGRFAELLAIDSLSANDAENLFVAGVLSVSDQLLRLPMEQIVAIVNLPRPIAQALCNREGIYGAYLSLIEACESSSVVATSLAEFLSLPIGDVNQTHASAIIWAKKVIETVEN